MSLSYAHGGSAVPLLGETIGANLERTDDQYPDNEALVSRHQGRRFTYVQFNDAVDVVARGLLDVGLEVGERVGMWSPNSYEWLLFQYATAKAGIILVNINPAYRTSELEYAMNQSGCRMLIAAPSFKTSDHVAMIDQVRPDLATLERTVFVDSDDWNALLTAGDSVPVDRLRKRMAGLEFDDPVNIQYTSGTTGFPKGATLSHHNILNNGFFRRGGVRLHRA
jgi:fatty-acyl-CoA synthase